MLPAHERFLVALEQQPWSGLYRVGIGYLLAPSFCYLASSEVLDWRFVVWFGVVLFALRVVPLVVRKMVPFSDEVGRIWMARRQRAKEYDSYQWRKLTWLGLGLALYGITSGNQSRMIVTITAFCLSGGLLGLACWSRISLRQLHPVSPT
jgi:hypothetical protein